MFLSRCYLGVGIGGRGSGQLAEQEQNLLLVFPLRANHLVLMAHLHARQRTVKLREKHGGRDR